ncbi:MAG: hypothetical protein IGS54_24360 [Elainella sp. C42_A2020_010]|nr:hypothetical protein [Elainella sp. C42_A2020_010]
MPLQLLAIATESLLEIDHIVICVSAPISAFALADLGLVSSSQPLRRLQQGTASRLIFFENVYLELLWVEDELAAEIYAMQSGIDFLARANWPQTQASPFSIALRPKSAAFNSAPTIDSQPFLNFAVDNWRTQSEPLCFVIPESISLVALLDPTSVMHQQLLAHPAQIQRLTSTAVGISTTTPLTGSMTLLEREGVISLELQSKPLLDLTFDHRRQKRTLDLHQLGIPAVLNY